MYQILIGPEDDQMLIIASDRDWLPTGNDDREAVQIACKDGFVAISEMR